MLSYGSYPEVSLREARDRHEDNRALLRKGVNPNQQRREARQAGETFKTAATAYLKTRAEGRPAVPDAIKRLVVKREHDGLSGRELAKLAGISEASVRRLRAAM